jgi:L-rhamnose mutarotase
MLERPPSDLLISVTIPEAVPASEERGVPMERFCFTFEIRPGSEDEYKRRHDEIWPELVEVIKGSGVSNYSLFRRGTTIIAYCEAEPDVATAFGKIGASDANTRWSEYFEDIIVALTDANGELFTAQEVWHLD